MDSREKEQTTPHQPLLSSLVVRPTDSGGGGRGGSGGEFETGEVRRDPPPYSRSNRYDGHRMHSGSVTPVRHRDAHRFSPDFEHSDSAPRSRGFGNGRNPGRYRDYSPPYGHGKNGGRFTDRGYDRSARGPGSLRVEGLSRNNPNVQPREGDWICSDPLCKNLNFARREYCNNCSRPRYGSSRSPRRGYTGPLFPPRERVPPALLDDSPGRIIYEGYRSPPRGWPRDIPRDIRPAGPAARHEGRFLDPLMRNDGQDYPEYDPRNRYDRPMRPDWGPRDRGRDNYFNQRRGYGRRMLAPPPAPAAHPYGWASHIRYRSRSPVRGGAQPEDYQPDLYVSRRRDDRHGAGRNAF